jgi:hypothetical protein
MKKMILIAGITMVLGLYALFHVFGTYKCTANIDIRRQNEFSVIGILRESTCPEYEDMLIKITDSRGSFLFNKITEMRISVESYGPDVEDTKTKNWQIVNMKEGNLTLSRPSFPKPDVEIISKKYKDPRANKDSGKD